MPFLLRLVWYFAKHFLIDSLVGSTVRCVDANQHRALVNGLGDDDEPAHTLSDDVWQVKSTGYYDDDDEERLEHSSVESSLDTPTKFQMDDFQLPAYPSYSDTDEKLGQTSLDALEIPLTNGDQPLTMLQADGKELAVPLLVVHAEQQLSEHEIKAYVSERFEI
jgi:hypothetical protein